MINIKKTKGKFTIHGYYSITRDAVDTEGFKVWEDHLKKKAESFVNSKVLIEFKNWYYNT